MSHNTPSPEKMAEKKELLLCRRESFYGDTSRTLSSRGTLSYGEHQYQQFYKYKIYFE